MKSALILLFGLHSLASASPYTLDKVIREMERNEKSITSARFSFEQDTLFENDMKAKVKGVAVFAKPGKFFIEKNYPDKQLTVSNGRKIWIYTPKHNQAWEGTVKGWVNSSMLPKGMLPVSDYVEELKKNFSLTLREQSDASTLGLDAQPKTADLGYRLEIVLSTESWLPVETVYRSDSATVTTKLSGLEINSEKSDKIFQFKAPKGTEIISLD